MGGCESCASARRKEVEKLLEESVQRGDLAELRLVIREAEAVGVDSLKARQQYCKLEKEDWQSPEHVRDMMKWAINTQDGVVLHNVIKEVSASAPDNEDLKTARGKLKEHHEEVLARMRRLARNRDVRALTVALDRARHIGVPVEDLAWAEESCKQLQGAKLGRVGGRT